jgi:hypothetical protein
MKNNPFLLTLLLLSGFAQAATLPYEYVPTAGGDISVIDTKTGVVIAMLPVEAGVLPESAKPINSLLDNMTEGYVLFEGEEGEIEVQTDNVKSVIINPKTEIDEAIFLDTLLDSFSSISGVFLIRIVSNGNGFGRIFTPVSLSKRFTPEGFYKSEKCFRKYCEEQYSFNNSRLSHARVYEYEEPIEKVVISAMPDANSKIIDLNCERVNSEPTVECTATFDLIPTCQDKNRYHDLTNNAIDVDGNAINTQTKFVGGVSTGMIHPKKDEMYNSSSLVNVCGIITVDPDKDMGQVADILVLFSYAPLDDENNIKYYTMSGEWDGTIAQLAFKENIPLANTIPLEIYSGALPEGSLGVYFGYRLTSGTIIHNSEPIKIRITP